jgi:Signal transduction histidine kinase regulating citrate/malate metabolism
MHTISYEVALLSLFSFFDILIFFNFSKFAFPHNKASRVFGLFLLQGVFLFCINVFASLSMANLIVQIITLGIVFGFLCDRIEQAISIACYLTYFYMIGEEIVYYSIGMIFSISVDELVGWPLFLSFLTMKVTTIILIYLYQKSIQQSKEHLEYPKGYWLLNIALPLSNIVLVVFLSILFPFGIFSPALAVASIILLVVICLISLFTYSVIAKSMSEKFVLQKQIDSYFYQTQSKAYEIRENLQCEVRGNTGIIAIDFIINQRMYEAALENINIEFDCSIRSEFLFEPYNTAFIIGSLLDNAMEAVRKIHAPTEEEKKIYIKLDADINIFSICIYNYYDGNADTTFLNKKTPKHGRSLFIINQLVQEHQGEMKISDDGHVLGIDIYLLQQVEKLN